MQESNFIQKFFICLSCSLTVLLTVFIMPVFIFAIFTPSKYPDPKEPPLSRTGRKSCNCLPNPQIFSQPYSISHSEPRGWQLCPEILEERSLATQHQGCRRYKRRTTVSATIMEVFKFYREFKSRDGSDKVHGSVQGVSVYIWLEINLLIKNKNSSLCFVHAWVAKTTTFNFKNFSS